MKYVISYDVVDDRRRGRVVKALLGYAHRVQKSVFEGLFSGQEIVELREKLEKLIEPKEDSVRIYPLCGTCEPKVLISGQGCRIEEIEYVIL